MCFFLSCLYFTVCQFCACLGAKLYSCYFFNPKIAYYVKRTGFIILPVVQWSDLLNFFLSHLCFEGWPHHAQLFSTVFHILLFSGNLSSSKPVHSAILFIHTSTKLLAFLLFSLQQSSLDYLLHTISAVSCHTSIPKYPNFPVSQLLIMSLWRRGGSFVMMNTIPNGYFVLLPVSSKSIQFLHGISWQSLCSISFHFYHTGYDIVLYQQLFSDALVLQDFLCCYSC